MNKAITDGLVLMPPAFAAGLDVWSRGNGTPGSDVYQGSGMAALVPADQDFGGCLEIVKTQATQKLRWMGETPILPGCYLRITARVKAVSGNLPNVRIAAWAGGAGGAHVGGVTEVGPSVTLTSYGEIVTVSAIVGTGQRTGVDMVWGTEAIYGHFGLDLTGPNGSVIRVDDIVIEDVTSAFLRNMMDWVDVRDFGAVGDGATDDSAAFEAADAAAAGRRVLVSVGTYRLAQNVTFESEVRFEGTVTMPANRRLALTRNFDLPSYIDAFGDEVLGFKKAIQALFNYSGHDSLDMRGRRIELSEPIDVQSVVGNLTAFHTRRVIRNGQLNAIASPNWDTDVVSSQATYAANNPNTLTAVANVANIKVGSLVTGTGVGREIYVKSKNVGAATVTLSQPLYGAVGTRNFTFRRFKYMLDFSGFSALSKTILADIEFQCSGESSAIMLAPEGLIFHLRDCFINKPKNRGITSIGGGCQGILIDRCQFLSNEQSLRVQDRNTIVMNVNSNDAKIRNNRVVLFAHFAIMAGTGHMFSGNHWFHGDSETNGTRRAGLVLTTPNSKTTINGNYIDNNFIELTNEYDATPNFNSQYSFGGLTITGNIFTVNDVGPWFNWIVIKPYGTGHFINGLNVSGNTFRALNGNIDRIDQVDTSFAPLDMSRSRNIRFEGNTFNSINQPVYNPVTLVHSENTDTRNWMVDFGPYLPFSGWIKAVTSIVPEGKISYGANTQLHSFPFAEPQKGADKDNVQITWERACRGDIQVTARMDTPV